MGAGWRALFASMGAPWDTYWVAEDFRHRHLTESLRGVITTLQHTARR